MFCSSRDHYRVRTVWGGLGSRLGRSRLDGDTNDLPRIPSVIVLASWRMWRALVGDRFTVRAHFDLHVFRVLPDRKQFEGFKLGECHRVEAFVSKEGGGAKYVF